MYDRADSAFALSRVEEYDWDGIFEGADRFHITGITPALGRNAEAVALAACKAAKEHGTAVSLDVNYRSKLWGAADAAKALEALFAYVDVCIINENHAKELFGASDERTLAERYQFCMRGVHLPQDAGRAAQQYLGQRTRTGSWCRAAATRWR